MSRSVKFNSNNHSVNFSYLKKRYPSNSYTQTFLNIKVLPQGQLDPIFQTDLDDDYLFTNFDNITLFYNYLNRHSKKDIVLFNNSDHITIMINLNGNDIEEEIISLNKVQIVNMKQYEILNNRVNFQNSQFKTKMIHKIQKTVNKYYKNNKEKAQKKTQVKDKRSQQKQKRIKIIPSYYGEATFQVKSDKQIFAEQSFQIKYRLNESNLSHTIQIEPNKLQEEEFVCKVESLTHQKLNVSVQYIIDKDNPSLNSQIKAPIRMTCQFGKSFSSSFCIEEGQQIGILRGQGELIIRNIATNNGKIFDQSISCQSAKICKIIISLQQH